MRLTPAFCSTLCLALLGPAPLFSQGSTASQATVNADRARIHASPDWQLIVPHLPDPATASVETLEMEGDLLRARRFPEDALDFYGYALKRGGNAVSLLNKMGVTELEMGNRAVARAWFMQAVKLNRKDTQAWNNLGASQFLDGEYATALRSYKRALKLNKRSAISHSNLGMTYVELKDYDSAKKELVTALQLDPQMFQHPGTAGTSLHMLSTDDRANFCFQMAKVYARLGNEKEMLHSLETASQAGMDIQYEMSKDRDLAPYVKDPRVVQIVAVAKSLRQRRGAPETVASALPPAAPAAQAVPATPVH
jgi:tetratricopeptide (TPR) repeat protein